MKTRRTNRRALTAVICAVSIFGGLWLMAGGANARTNRFNGTGCTLQTVQNPDAQIVRGSAPQISISKPVHVTIGGPSSDPLHSFTWSASVKPGFRHVAICGVQVWINHKLVKNPRFLTFTARHVVVRVSAHLSAGVGIIVSARSTA